MLKQKVVAAIDFGTHGSGYAWAVISDQNKDARRRQIKVRTQWKSQPVAAVKNLSAILLDAKQNVTAWGYDAKRLSASRPELPYAASFKMRLHGDTLHDSALSKALPPTSDLIRLYLKELYSHALDDISKSGYLEAEIRWCLTIPAIWDDYQKQVMWEAAVAAGMPDDEKRLVLAIEPEAAAHYARTAGVRTLGATGGRRANLMSPGSRFIVADCGGGTIDVTAYRTDVSGKLSEIGRDYGGPYGSEYLNKHFLDVVASKIGGFDALARIIQARGDSILDLLATWETAKLTIMLGQSDRIFISIPAAMDRLLSDEARADLRAKQDGVDDQIVLMPDDITEIFERLLPKVISLLDGQVAEVERASRSSAPALIVLVGGFGDSPYLQARLAKHFRGRAEILLPPQPGAAVLLGAAHFAYDPQTRARRSKYTYGCEFAPPFRDGVDSASKLIVRSDGERRCNDRFNQFVVNGQAVAVDEAVANSFCPLEDDQDSIVFGFYRTRKLNPVYVDEQLVEKIGSLRVSLEKLAGRPAREKAVLLTMYFGETRIRARAVVEGTAEVMEASLDFDSMLGR